MASVKVLTVQEALDLIQDEDLSSDEDSPADLVIVPPDTVDELTDEEDGDEEALEAAAPELRDVPGVEAHMPVREGDAEPPKKCQKSDQPRWSQTTPQFNRMPAPTDGVRLREKKVKDDLTGKSPVELFEELFTEEIYSHLICETLRYAVSSKNDPLFTLPLTDLKAFLGVLLLTGYHKLPSERHYWSNAGDLGVPAVKEALSRNRYASIKSYLHFTNNEEASNNRNDRGFKIRPLMDLLSQTFQKFGIFTEDLVIDEMIVKYFGRNSLKRFVRGKPIRFGYKLWALCSQQGYCYKFSLFCGKEENSNSEPLGTRVVLDMLQSVETSTDHQIYFDNFFTSRSLLVTLSERGIRATGAVRENRTGWCPVTDQKTFKATAHGHHERWFDSVGEVCVVQWNDSRCVTVMSNHEADLPLTPTWRWDRAQRAYKKIPQPQLIHRYSQCIGAVDSHNGYCEQYATGIKGKKWYWTLFTRMLDMAVVNAWVLHCMVHEAASIPLLEFRREVAVVYLRRAAASRPRPTSVPLAAPPAQLRYDGLDHLVAPGDKQRHCRRERCNRRPRFQCVKCKVTLCIECFIPYHTRADDRR